MRTEGGRATASDVRVCVEDACVRMHAQAPRPLDRWKQVGRRGLARLVFSVVLPDLHRNAAAPCHNSLPCLTFCATVIQPCTVSHICSQTRARAFTHMCGHTHAHTRMHARVRAVTLHRARTFFCISSSEPRAMAMADERREISSCKHPRNLFLLRGTFEGGRVG